MESSHQGPILQHGPNSVATFDLISEVLSSTIKTTILPEPASMGQCFLKLSILAPPGHTTKCARQNEAFSPHPPTLPPYTTHPRLFKPAPGQHYPVMPRSAPALSAHRLPRPIRARKYVSAYVRIHVRTNQHGRDKPFSRLTGTDGSPLSGPFRLFQALSGETTRGKKDKTTRTHRWDDDGKGERLG